jgi:hypothetical protein
MDEGFSGSGSFCLITSCLFSGHEVQGYTHGLAHGDSYNWDYSLFKKKLSHIDSLAYLFVSHVNLLRTLCIPFVQGKKTCKSLCIHWRRRFSSFSCGNTLLFHLQLYSIFYHGDAFFNVRILVDQGNYKNEFRAFGGASGIVLGTFEMYSPYNRS